MTATIHYLYTAPRIARERLPSHVITEWPYIALACDHIYDEHGLCFECDAPQPKDQDDE